MQRNWKNTDFLLWEILQGVPSESRMNCITKNCFISCLESMVDRYLEKGTMYVLEDNDVKAECVVTDEGNGILEIKNIAVDVVMLLCMYQLK